MIVDSTAPLRKKSQSTYKNKVHQTALLQQDHAIDPLSWLQQQTEYPKFYWRSRDCQIEMSGAGTLRNFTSIASAQAFIAQQALIGIFPVLLGGEQFPVGTADNSADSPRAYLFLPKKMLLRRGDQMFFYGNADSGDLQRTLDNSTQAEQFSAEPLPELGPREDCPNRQDWCSLVSKVIDPVSLYRLPKVVLARRSRFQLTEPVDAYRLLRKWRESEGNTFPFMLQSSPADSFQGCTPERLYRRVNRSISTEALAGTLRRLNRGESEIRSDVKIRRENFHVQDFIENRLQPVCETVQIPSSADVVKLKCIQHLRKSITGVLKSHVDDSQLLKLLHPTPAVGGSPWPAAKEFIRHNEDFDRGWYAGAIGYMSARETDFSVAIRSARLTRETLDLFAGAGIVAGSEPLAEWLELESKLEGVLQLFPAPICCPEATNYSAPESFCDD